jgi:hypothetical protein
MEASLMNATYTEYIDVESFANWMLAHDILGDIDAAGSNIFLTKYDDSSTSKIMMGPLWDFDWIMNAEEWAYIHKFYYFPLLFESENETFRNTYSRRWKDIKDILFDALFEYFDQFVESPEGQALNAAIPYHNNRWAKYKLQPVQTYFESAKSYFETRKLWLDENIQNTATAIQLAKTNRESLSERVYNIAGQPTTTSSKGIKLKKGRKFLVN